MELPAGRFYFKPQYLTDKFESGLISDYCSLFQGLRYRKISFLEVGMGQGGSTLFFEQYFVHSDTKIIGIDLVIPKSTLDRPKIITYECDQNDTKRLIEISERHGPFDIILDDGAHQLKETKNTFEACHKYLKKGGYYIVEDFMAQYLDPKYDGMTEFIGNLVTHSISYGFGEMKVLVTDRGSTAIFRKTL